MGLVQSCILVSSTLCDGKCGRKGMSCSEGCFSPNLRFPFVFPQERAADDSKEVESFQQLLNARTQVGCGEKERESPVYCFLCVCVGSGS